MGVLIVLMGPTGAGKSVQGDLLAEEYGGVHLSSGKLLRQHPRTAALLEDGRLAPAEEVERVMGEVMDEIPENKPLILDGFPRTLSNVEWLENETEGHKRKLTKVILIELDLEMSLKRLKHRDRADDSPEAVREKWDLFNEKTRPVVEYYERAHMLVRVDGRGTIEEVHAQIMVAMS